MMLLLAASCQKDESADIDADGGQPSTEVSPRQLQNRAREIVNSEEYQAFVNQNRSFLSKIHSRGFLSEGLFNFENGTYNLDVIKERLSMTSFESAEEFVQENEKVAYNTQELVKKYPELTNPSLELKQEISERFLKTTINNKRNKRLRTDGCGLDCDSDRWYCKSYAEDDLNWNLLGCGIANLGGLVCGAGIPAAFVGICICIGTAYTDYERAIDRCENEYWRCVEDCLDSQF